MADSEQNYYKATEKTVGSLKSIAYSLTVSDLSRLSLPEVEAVVDQVAQLVPAGNVPAVILSGLARLQGRRPPPTDVKRDVNLLFKGVRQVLDKTTYYTFFAGPAAAIWGYQNLLKLAGMDPEDSFPEGTWQFYVDYAMREDTARHGNETHGFDTNLKRHNVQLSQADRMTAWVMAAISCLHQYDHLLANEWRERVYTYLLAELTQHRPDAAYYSGLYRAWARQRPYQRGTDAGPYETYPAYRRRKFDQFLYEAIARLSPDQDRQWQEQLQALEAESLPAYQRQMSILAYLDPDVDGETRHPIPLAQAQIGLIYRGRYHLISACTPSGQQPAEVLSVRAQIASLVNYPDEAPPTSLIPLAQIQRWNWPKLRKQLNPTLLENLAMLRLAPILFNFDRRPHSLPLAELRQAERGIGDHPLTLFDTGQTLMMDQSHIFFDGTWGAALAEILSNEALSWAFYLATLPPPPGRPGLVHPYTLAFPFQKAELAAIQKLPRVTPEISAETDTVNLKAIRQLRKLFKRYKNDLRHFTVNDVLVLYQAIHTLTYRPTPGLVNKLRRLATNSATHQAATEALAAIQSPTQLNPTLVIPVDGSWRNPRDRLYPITFEVPLHELDLLSLHRRCITALDSYQQENSLQHYNSFNELQRTYLATLGGFGSVFSRAKEIAGAGESVSVSTIKLLAHMPTPLQRMLDRIPNRIDLLNDLIKGREVFSNLGAVAPTSTLTRFITAKDDNEKKTLAWGVITDAQGVMRVSLRDFRPHVRALITAGHKEIAREIAQEYLKTYAHGLNNYIKELLRITETSQEMRLLKPEK